MNNTAESNDILRKLCEEQPLAVLATDTGNGPYASLVAVAVTPDLRRLFFTTLRATRKWANLAGNSHVSLLIDNRSNQVSDFSQAAAATILGNAVELSGAELESGLALFLDRHPHLAEFTASPNCALFRVQITNVYLVTRFQNVMEFLFSP
ncbi:MAG: pyridoxamine 5'-phosphate oxidase family protein [Deltaproteobacteria bacterium]|nr:pyridoxamine 5'-phosphate oxidase family protein [Deltaproteobacteria bacterium]TLN02048.1 MAG: pyridoxamine 5'-phosphate oxidase family protein [bacterium]